MDDLVTERLVLHPMSFDEAARVAAGAPAEGDRWAPGYPADGDVVGARHFLERGDTQPFGAYEIRRRDDGEAIGGAGFHGAPDATGTVIIGYGLIPEVRGKGYATEALRELLRFARAGGVTRVVGDTDLDNVASQHVMAAAGMRFTGEDERVKYYELAL
jgi:RimJ/RimL family protein N-acetyltransferase